MPAASRHSDRRPSAATSRRASTTSPSSSVMRAKSFRKSTLTACCDRSVAFGNFATSLAILATRCRFSIFQPNASRPISAATNRSSGARHSRPVSSTMRMTSSGEAWRADAQRLKRGDRGSEQCGRPVVAGMRADQGDGYACTGERQRRGQPSRPRTHNGHVGGEASVTARFHDRHLILLTTRGPATRRRVLGYRFGHRPTIYSPCRPHSHPRRPMLDLLFDPNAWAALVTLSALEIVLGIDNVVFISVLVSRLPARRRRGRARSACARARLPHPAAVRPDLDDRPDRAVCHGVRPADSRGTTSS